MTTNPFYEVDMQIEDLAKFLFTENVNNVPIELSLGGIDDNKDLFFFCLDLFCKGLVLLYGEGSKSVSIESITDDQFKNIKSKLLCAGIKVNLYIYPLDIDVEVRTDDNKSMSILNIEELNSAPNNKLLQEYEFKLINHDMMYIVNFNLVHKI